MAIISIIESNKPYYTVRVVCCGQQFNQTIVTDKAGDALMTFLLDYADEYESALVDCGSTDLAEAN